MPGETILVIDDSLTIQRLVQLVLSEAGYRVNVAADGESGLHLAKEEPPALVLLDYELPDMTGYDVWGAMSGDMQLARVPLVIMSAQTEDLIERFAAATVVVDSISKPFSPDALLAVVAGTLAKAAESRAARDGGRPGQDAVRSLRKPRTSATMRVATATPPPPPPPEALRERRSATRPVVTLPAPAEPPRLPPPRRVEGAVSAPVPSAADASAALAEGVALAGELATVPVPDVLTLLADLSRTGVLRVRNDPAKLDVFVRDGRVDLATAVGVADEFLLGRFLIETGAVDEAVLTRVLDERAQASAASGATLRLGADLIARGECTEAALREAMVQQTSALVFEALRWSRGRFTFAPEAPFADVAREAALQLNVDALLLEGIRRIDEWRIIEREVHDFEQVFVRNDEKLAALGRGKLTRDELAVLELVNGKHTVKDIIYLSKLGSFDVSKMLFRLVRSKLVRRRVAPRAVS